MIPSKESKIYRIKEIFYSIQGEGFYSGRPAVFIRFSGCNLWSGLEIDRPRAICRFCDTDFVGTDGKNGGEYTLRSLIDKIHHINKDTNCKFIVLTGGEPLLQLDDMLISELKAMGNYIAVETNGTKSVIKNIDWITVSPKFGAKLIQISGDELKLVYPQKGMSPQDYVKMKFKHFYLQPKDETQLNQNLEKTISYCLNNPLWRISVQLHKVLGVE